MKRYGMTCLMAAAILFGPALPVHAQGKNAMCPVMPGTMIKEKFYLDYQGERIYFCCRACVKAFKKTPQKYLERLRHDG